MAVVIFLGEAKLVIKRVLATAGLGIKRVLATAGCAIKRFSSLIMKYCIFGILVVAREAARQAAPRDGRRRRR